MIRDIQKYRAVMVFFAILVFPHPIRAESVVTCLQTHPNNCNKQIYEYYSLPSTEKAAQVPTLMALMQTGLSDFSPDAQAAAGNAGYLLSHSGGDLRGYIPTLVQFFSLGNEHGALRASAGTVLASIGSDAVPALRDAMNSGTPQVTIGALQTFSRMHQLPSDVISEMERLLDDSNSTVSQSAKEALVRQGSDAFFYVQKWTAQHSAPAPLPAPTDSNAASQMDTLLAQTKSPDAAKRHQAIMALVQWELGQLGPGQQAMGLTEIANAESAMIDALKDPDAQVRADAMLGVQHLKRYVGNARECFLEGLSDPSETVRARAIQGMAALNPPDPGFEKQLMSQLDKEFADHPEEYVNGINADSVYWQGLNALKRLATPEALAKAAEMEQTFNVRYAEKLRQDKVKEAEANQREFESLRFRVPAWAKYFVRGLFFLWVAVYIIRYPPTTTPRVIFWMSVAAFIFWIWWNGYQQQKEIQKILAAPPPPAPSGPLITF